MVKITFTNNAGTTEEIMDENKSVRALIEEARFSYEGANIIINGRMVSDMDLDNPLGGYVGGATEVRITAVAHKQNA